MQHSASLDENMSTSPTKLRTVSTASTGHGQGARVAELEEEVQELRRKLERAEARVAQKDGGAGSLAREVSLEKELDEVHTKLIAMRQEKAVLENSVRVCFPL